MLPAAEEVVHRPVEPLVPEGAEAEAGAEVVAGMKGSRKQVEVGREAVGKKRALGSNRKRQRAQEVPMTHVLEPVQLVVVQGAVEAGSTVVEHLQEEEEEEVVAWHPIGLSSPASSLA